MEELKVEGGREAAKVHRSVTRRRGGGGFRPHVYPTFVSWQAAVVQPRRAVNCMQPGLLNTQTKSIEVVPL